MKENTPIEVLLERCADGDRSAFERLYRVTSPRLFGLLIKMLRQKDLAEDVLQDTFVQVWRRAGSFTRDRGQAEAWLTSIARNRAIDWIRRGGQRELLADDDSLLDQPSDDTEPDQRTIELQTSGQLHRCLNQLKGQQRTGIRLAFLGGMSHGEVAAQLDAPLGTTKSWIRRGLESLKRCLARAGVGL